MSKKPKKKRSKKGRKPKKPQEKEIKKYKGVEYDSNEELYFLFWAFELKKEGYINKVSRASPYLLANQIDNSYIKELKTKSKPMSQRIRPGHSYTPDFTIEWKKDKEHVFYWIMNNKKRGKYEKSKLIAHKINNKIVTFIEIKPQFDYKNMERAAKINIKWVYEKYKEYINIVKCPILFRDTFTPNSYLVTKTGKKRKINWPIKSLNQYLKN